MSTLPKRKLVVRRAWALSPSKSSSNPSPCQREDVPVTGAVDDDGRREREPTLLALEDHALRRCRRGAIAATTQQCMSVCTFDSRTMSLVTSFRTSGSTVGDQCTVSRKRCRTDAPVGGFDGVLRTPDLGERSERCVWAAPVDELRADAGHDEVPIPVGHPVDPRHETAGRKAAQVVVSLDQHGVGPEAAGRDGGGRAGRPAADDQHVAAAVDGGRPGGLLDRRTWLRLHDPLLSGV